MKNPPLSPKDSKDMDGKDLTLCLITRGWWNYVFEKNNLHNWMGSILQINSCCNHMSINHDSITLKIMIVRYEIHLDYKLQKKWY